MFSNFELLAVLADRSPGGLGAGRRRGRVGLGVAGGADVLHGLDGVGASLLLGSGGRAGELLGLLGGGLLAEVVVGAIVVGVDGLGAELGLGDEVVRLPQEADVHEQRVAEFPGGAPVRSQEAGAGVAVVEEVPVELADILLDLGGGHSRFDSGEDPHGAGELQVLPVGGGGLHRQLMVLAPLVQREAALSGEVVGPGLDLGRLHRREEVETRADAPLLEGRVVEQDYVAVRADAAGLVGVEAVHVGGGRGEWPGAENCGE